MSVFIFPPTVATVDTGTLATEATQLLNEGHLASIQASNTSIDSKVLTDTQLRASPVPVSGPLTDVQLRATAVPVSGPLTDTELRATAVPVSAASLPLPTGAATEATLAGVLTDTQLRASPVAVSGPLTDTQLRATAVPVSGPLTDTQLRATAVPVSAASLPLPSGAATEATVATLLTDTQLRATPVPISGTVSTGGLTDTELRATPVPVSGPLTDTQLRATAVPVSGPLTDTQLRATAVPVSAASLPLPSGAATETTLSAVNSAQTSGSQKSQIVDGAGDVADVLQMSTQVTSTDKGLVTNSVIHGLSTGGGGGYVDVKVTPSGALAVDATVSGAVAVTGPLTDAQLRASAVPVSAASLPLPSGAATEATLSSIDTKLTTTNSDLSSVISNTNRLAPVDQIDTTPLLDTSSTSIPASASNPVQVVASLAATARKVVSVEDIGEFIGLYTGAALSEVLHCVLPLGGGEVEVNLPSGTRISLRNMKNATIASGSISINFLG